MPEIVCFQGIPGSGKSFIAARDFPDHAYCSSDDYMKDKDGVYKFEPAKLSLAHGNNLLKFHKALWLGRDVVVDNTNTQAWELAPYVAWGLANGHKVRIIRVDCPASVAFARQQHAVPLNTLNAMMGRLKDRLPPHWPKVEVIING